MLPSKMEEPISFGFGLEKLQKILQSLELPNKESPVWTLKSFEGTLHLDVRWSKSSTMQPVVVHGAESNPNSKPTSKSLETSNTNPAVNHAKKKKSKSPSTRRRNKERLLKWLAAKNSELCTVSTRQIHHPSLLVNKRISKKSETFTAVNDCRDTVSQLLYEPELIINQNPPEDRSKDVSNVTYPTLATLCIPKHSPEHSPSSEPSGDRDRETLVQRGRELLRKWQERRRQQHQGKHVKVKQPIWFKLF